MADRITALDILTRHKDWSPDESALIVLVGDDPFLARHMLGLIRAALCPDEADRAWAWREFSGADELDPRDVFDEAATVPLFAGATRAAVVREADAFVSAARERLEAIAQAGRGRRGVVILEVKTFPATTRLAKAAVQSGLVIDISVPPKADLARWVRAWAKSHHGVELAAATAQRLIERLGGSLGQVDQALQRLCGQPSGADRVGNDRCGCDGLHRRGHRATCRTARGWREPDRHWCPDGQCAEAAFDGRPFALPAGQGGPPGRCRCGATGGGGGGLAEGDGAGEGVTGSPWPTAGQIFAALASRARSEPQG